MGRARALRPLPLLGLLLACATGEPELPPPPCPRVAFIHGVEAVEDYPGASDAQRFAVRLSGIRGGCRYEQGGVSLAYSFDLLVDLLAGTAPEVLEVPYFVSVLDERGRLLDKKRFVARVGFTGGRRAGVREHIEQRLEGADEKVGPAWRILISLDLPTERALELWRRRSL